MSYNLKSLDKMIDFLNDRCGGLETPEICIECDEIFALNWYGERGNLVIAFEEDEIAYSYIGNNGEVDYGVIDDNFDSLWKRAGVRFLLEVSKFDSKTKKKIIERKK